MMRLLILIFKSKGLLNLVLNNEETREVFDNLVRDSMDFMNFFEIIDTVESNFAHSTCRSILFITSG